MLGTYLNIKSLNQWRFRGRISTRLFFVFLIPGGIRIWKFWFLRGGKNRSTRRKTSQSHKKGHTTNSTHIWRPRQHWNPRLIGGRRVLSPLRHHDHCSLLAPYVCENVPVIYKAKIPNMVLFFLWNYAIQLYIAFTVLEQVSLPLAIIIHAVSLLCQLRIFRCHTPYATTELFDELKVSAPLFRWALIFQWTAV